MSDCTTRCSGHCCELIALPLSPNGLLDYTEAGGEDGAALEDALIYLGYGPGEPDRIHAGLRAWRIANAVDADCHWYRCRHHQENGDCGIYETRPQLCRRYPYHRACEQAACTSCWALPVHWRWAP